MRGMRHNTWRWGVADCTITVTGENTWYTLLITQIFDVVLLGDDPRARRCGQQFGQVSLIIHISVELRRRA